MIIIVAILSCSYEYLSSLASSSFFFYVSITILSLIFRGLILYYWDREEVYDRKLKALLYLGCSCIIFCNYSCNIIFCSDVPLSISGQNFVLTMSEAGIVVGLVLAAVMIFVYYTADFVEDYLDMEYSIIFGGVMVVLAFVFLILAFVLPTIAATLSAPITELTFISMFILN